MINTKIQFKIQNPFSHAWIRMAQVIMYWCAVRMGLWTLLYSSLLLPLLSSVHQSHYQCSGTKQHATPIPTKRYYAMTNMTYIDYIMICYAIRPGISINVATGEIHHRAPGTILPSPSRSGRAPLVEPHPSPPGHTQSPYKPGWHIADPGHPLPW